MSDAFARFVASALGATIAETVSWPELLRDGIFSEKLGLCTSTRAAKQARSKGGRIAKSEMLGSRHSIS